MLTEFQRRKFARAFELIDEDGSAFLDRADLSRIAQRFVRRAGVQEHSERYRTLAARAEAFWEVLAEMDGDGDGRLTLDEWTRALASLADSEETYGHLFGPLMEQSFDLLDADADGAVTCEEFVLWLTAIGLDEATARQVFAEFDLDDDGLLGTDEVGFLLLDFFHSDDPDARGSWLLGF